MEERTGFEEYIRCYKRVFAFNGPSAKRKDIKSFLVVFTLYVSLDCVILPTIGPSAYQVLITPGAPSWPVYPALLIKLTHLLFATIFAVFRPSFSTSQLFSPVRTKRLFIPLQCIGPSDGHVKFM